MKYIKTIEIDIDDIAPAVAEFCAASDTDIEVSMRYESTQKQRGYFLRVYVPDLNNTGFWTNPQTDALFRKALEVSQDDRYDDYFNWAYLSDSDQEAEEMLKAYISYQKARYPNCVIKKT